MELNELNEGNEFTEYSKVTTEIFNVIIKTLRELKDAYLGGDSDG